MNVNVIDPIVAAVLYEGYLLYPYRASALKNRQRFTLGTLFPRSYSELQNGTDAWTMRTECLIEGPSPKLEIRLRFLHPLLRQVCRVVIPAGGETAGQSPEYEPVAALELGDEVFQTWQEVVEQDFALTLDATDAGAGEQSHLITFPANETTESIAHEDGSPAGIMVRRQQEIQAEAGAQLERLAENLYKITVTLRNQTPFDATIERSRDDAVLQSLASPHIMMAATDGRLISLLEPTDRFTAAAEACRNEGCWPVLVGEPGQRDLMLASPIILYDYPQIAPESDGDFFDGTEIDEMLALRVMTLTEGEKREMRSVDSRARQILERADGMSPAQLGKLHGTVRDRTPVVESRE